MPKYLIRTMCRKELDFAIALATNEGWNPGLHDGDCFYQTDPKGFLIGLLDGRPIACISAVSYGGVFGFIGFYIVVPEHRGRGYGLQLWNTAMKRLKDHNIGLDGVIQQQSNYIKSGFKLAYRNIRYEGVARRSKALSTQVATLDTIDFDKLWTYDRDFFPGDRKSFLKCWTHMRKSVGVAHVENGQIRGYGIIRTCRHGHKIGPLFADTPQIAESIFCALGNNVEEDAPIFLDVPKANIFAVDLADRHQMAKIFETARMYTREQPALPIDSLFGVTTFELG